METHLDFSNYKFRASQVYLLMGGVIGLTEKQEQERLDLIARKNGAALGETDENGKTIKPLTKNMEDRLEELEKAKADQSLPLTMQKELRKIYRTEKFNRTFGFTNKYTQKGIVQENEAITALQNYLNRDANKVLFTKNETRLFNDYVQGEPDINPIVLDGIKKGFDTKASWELETLPFDDDELNPQYDWQNHSYIWLTDSDEWITAYCLVNIHEHGLNNEKLKYWYPLGCPQDYEDEYYEEYVEKCKKLEIRLIFDYDRFVTVNPQHLLEISREEWMETINPVTGLKGYDIPLSDRIIEKTTLRSEEKREEMIKRIEIARKYLNSLND